MREQTSSTWTPAVFRIAMGTQGRTTNDNRFSHWESVTGETWGAFGLNADRGSWGTDWIVTHLPTGWRIATVESKRAARRFCEDIAPLTDWTTIVPGRIPPDIKAAVFAAYYRGRGSAALPAGAVAAEAGQ